MGLLGEPGCGAAISGEIPRFSFTNSDSVERVTPRGAAAWVMVKPNGSLHWRSTKPPGCGGFFIGLSSDRSALHNAGQRGAMGPTTAVAMHARSLAPLVKTRGFGMTPLK